jgi:hypothetical protein
MQTATSGGMISIPADYSVTAWMIFMGKRGSEALELKISVYKRGERI